MSDGTYILVVDDNVLRGRWTKHVLADLPSTVVTVPSVHQGLQCLRRTRFDAVVVTEHLRGMNFQRFSAVLRKRYPVMPVIVTSFTWPVGRNVMTMSPGAHHCLVLCAQDREAALQAAVRKALLASRGGEQDMRADMIKVNEKQVGEKLYCAISA